jgi:hypothetical protein
MDVSQERDASKEGAITTRPVQPTTAAEGILLLSAS